MNVNIEFYQSQQCNITNRNLVEMKRKPVKYKCIPERYRRAIKNVIPYINKNSYILDVGCRDGTGIKILNDSGYTNVIGIDLSKEAIYQARKKLHNDTILLISDIHDNLLTNFNSYFDLILMIHLLEHTYDPQNCLNKIYHLLSPDGFLFIEVPQQRECAQGRKNGHYNFFKDKNDLLELIKTQKFVWLNYERLPQEKSQTILLKKRIDNE